MISVLSDYFVPAAVLQKDPTGLLVEPRPASDAESDRDEEFDDCENSPDDIQSTSCTCAACCANSNINCPTAPLIKNILRLCNVC